MGTKILCAAVLFISLSGSESWADCNISDSKIEEAILQKPELRDPINRQLVRDLRSLRDRAILALGMAAALNRNTWVDYLASGIATLGLTIPVFVISMLLILIFAVWLGWFPASGWGKPERWVLPIMAYAAIRTRAIRARPCWILSTGHSSPRCAPRG